MTTGYETVRRLAHENLLPALERFTVLLSRLRGLSKFQDSSAALGLSTQELDNVLDTTACLQLLAHHVLIAAGSELRGFAAFSAWLKYEIEAQSTEPGSSAAQEASERDPNIDHVSTLDYIRGPMKQSRLFALFNMSPSAQERPQWDLNAEGRSLYELYKRELKTIGEFDSSERQLPGLDALIGHLHLQCRSVFAGIAANQKRNIRLGSPVRLGQVIPESVDMRMLAAVSASAVNIMSITNICYAKDVKDRSLYNLYVATISRSRDENGKLVQRRTNSLLRTF